MALVKFTVMKKTPRRFLPDKWAAVRLIFAPGRPDFTEKGEMKDDGVKVESFSISKRLTASPLRRASRVRARRTWPTAQIDRSHSAPQNALTPNRSK